MSERWIVQTQTLGRLELQSFRDTRAGRKHAREHAIKHFLSTAEAWSALRLHPDVVEFWSYYRKLSLDKKKDAAAVERATQAYQLCVRQTMVTEHVVTVALILSEVRGRLRPHVAFVSDHGVYAVFVHGPVSHLATAFRPHSKRKSDAAFTQRALLKLARATGRTLEYQKDHPNKGAR